MGKRILLIPKGFLGDILLTTPVVAAVKRSDPDAAVIVMCTPTTADCVRRDPLVNEVIVFDRRGAGWGALRRAADRLRSHNIDTVFSFHRSGRTALLLWLAGIRERVAFVDAYLSHLYTHRIVRPRGGHDVLRNLALVKPFLSEQVQHEIDCIGSLKESDHSWCDLRFTESPLSDASGRAHGSLKGRTYVVLAPGSAWETKRWDAKCFREVAEKILARGTHVVVVGAKQDQGVCDEVAHGLAVDNLCGATSIDELAAIIRGATCVLCNDSLALHICSATKTPVVAIFCATSPTFGFGPWRTPSIVIERRGLFCKPCHRHGSRACPTGTRLCMTGVDLSEVVCAVFGFLGEQGHTGERSLLRCVKSS